MVFSGIAIGFMGWGVWAHHMFASGIGPISVAAFSLSTMFIAVPTGVKILNWLATMWAGKLRFTTPMLFSVGLVTMFTIGGLSGVTHAVAPANLQHTDTYYIVAHFHYVLFGGAMFGFFAGFYFWWPKVFGYLLNEKLGKLHFWLTLIGFNMTFGPMHILGLQGMSRRIFTYRDGFGFNFWNMVATIGSFIIAASLLVFFYNIWYSRKVAKDLRPPGPDPWDARSLEWSIPSPAPEHNFDDTPIVTRFDDFWHRKYAEDEHGRTVKVADGADIAMPGDPSRAHLPSPSYFPILLAFGLPFIAYGLIFNLLISFVGAAIVLFAFVGWSLEPTDDPEAGAHGGHGGHGEHGGHGDDEGPPGSGGAPTEPGPEAAHETEGVPR
jgi:cytochrome c oxidase subunit 1